MDKIINAMRVLAEELSIEACNNPLSSATHTISSFARSLISAADRLEADSKEPGTEEIGDGWIEWGGGDCPVPKGTIVEVKYRGGDSTICPALVRIPSCNQATEAFWRNDNSSADIIAYRVVKS